MNKKKIKFQKEHFRSIFVEYADDNDDDDARGDEPDRQPALHRLRNDLLCRSSFVVVGRPTVRCNKNKQRANAKGVNC